MTSKEIQRFKNRLRYLAKRDYYIAKARRWAAEHPEETRAARRRWYMKNKQSLKRCRRAYYAANREKMIERAKQWNREHPEAARAAQRKYYRRKKREADTQTGIAERDLSPIHPE